MGICCTERKKPNIKSYGGNSINTYSSNNPSEKSKNDLNSK